jgi:hypothetical protein
MTALSLSMTRRRLAALRWLRHLESCNLRVQLHLFSKNILRRDSDVCWRGERVGDRNGSNGSGLTTTCSRGGIGLRYSYGVAHGARRIAAGTVG